MFFVCQGLILSKALKAQKDAEDESTRIALGNLRSEVITLRNEALEKDKILLSLVERLKSSEAKLASLSKVEQKMEKFEKEKEADAKRIADLEYALSIQVGLHRSEVQGLEKKLDEITKKYNQTRLSVLMGGGFAALEPVREKVEFGEAFVIVSPALLLRRRADVES